MIYNNNDWFLFVEKDNGFILFWKKIISCSFRDENIYVSSLILFYDNICIRLGYRILWGFELVFWCDEEIWCFREGNNRGDYCYCSFGL